MNFWAPCSKSSRILFAGRRFHSSAPFANEGIREQLLVGVKQAMKTESASQFVKGERPDLAEKEAREAEIISAFLPPMISEAEIDRILKEVVASCPRDGNTKKVLGLMFKSFYSKVDKANVNPDLVKSRAEALLNL